MSVKKFFIAFCAIIISFSASFYYFSVVAFAESANSYITLPKNEFEKGEEFTISIKYYGEDLGGCITTVIYDTEFLECVDKNATDGKINCNVKYDTAQSFIMFDITFKAIKGGESRVVTSKTELIKYKTSEKIEITEQGATVAIKDLDNQESSTTTTPSTMQTEKTTTIGKEQDTISTTEIKTGNILFKQDQYPIVNDYREIGSVPNGLVETTVKYKGSSYLAYTTKNNDAFFLCLREGKALFFVEYDPKTEKCCEMTKILIASNAYIIVNLGQPAPDDFKEKTIIIGATPVRAYENESSNNDSMYLLYAIGKDGVLKKYMYDSIDNTIQRYIDTDVPSVKSNSDSEPYFIIISLLFTISLAISILCISEFVYIKRKKKDDFNAR